MTRAENRKFLRYGFVFMNLAAGLLVTVLLSKEYGFFHAGSWIVPFLVAMLGVTALLAFVFLLILGLFPHLLRFDRDNVANEREKHMLEPLGYFVIED